MKYQLTSVAEAVVVTFAQKVTDENVEDLFSEFCQINALRVIDKSNGLDRVCWNLEWQEQQYVLHFEHYTERVWVELGQTHGMLKAFVAHLGGCCGNQ